MFDNLYIRGIRKGPAPPGEEDSYVFTLPAVAALDKLEFTSKVTFLVGENGTGKSTLLEAIAVGSGFNPEGGTVNFNFATNETHSPLYKALTMVKGTKRPRDGFFLRTESFYNVASEIERLGVEPNYGGVSLHHQSHGESFIALMINRFGGHGIYLLDEPEAALSPARQLTLLALIHNLVRRDSQLIIATHSPILMSYPGAEILVISESGICSTPYEETEHYTLSKRFLNNPGQTLKHLLADDE